MASELGDHLRAIIGQKTEPPLWIYVTKDQIPMLERAAAALDAADDAFVNGAIFALLAVTDRERAARRIYLRHFADHPTTDRQKGRAGR